MQEKSEKSARKCTFLEGLRVKYLKMIQEISDRIRCQWTKLSRNCHPEQQTKKMLIGNRRKCKENRNTGISGQRNTDRKKLKAPKKQKMMTIRKGLQKK